MKIASISAIKYVKTAGLILFAFASNNSLAQTASGNIVNVATPDVCAAACGRDNMCASWTFRPNPNVNGQPAGGQCQFSKPNPNNAQGSVNFVQARPSANVPNWTQSNIPTWNAPNQRGGNYSVTPLPSYSTQQARVASVPSPNIAMASIATPIVQHSTNPTMTNSGASISFERPNSTAPQAQMQAPAQPKLDWRPVETAPQVATTQPSPNLNAYRASDGSVDAAQMRRDQLASQNRSGQPRYSVQGEWTGVAQSVANGQNQTGIDWANTTPIPQPQEPTQKAQSAEAAITPTRSRGPLRAKRQQTAQEASIETESSEPKKGFFENLGNLFGGRNQTREDQANENAPQESERVTAMHGPLRKRAATSQE